MTPDTPDAPPFEAAAARPTRSSLAGVPPVRRRRGRPGNGQGLSVCLLVTVGGLGAAAALGGLRLIDLVTAGLVMAIVILLGVRDSRHLPMAVTATWFYAPLGRRVADWLSGGYVSVTAMSLLPLLASSALLIPLLGRVRLVPRRLYQPLALLALPPVLASSVGLFRFGPGAAAEAGQWLLPLLFVPYLATRAMPDREVRRLTRGLVLLAASSALYGVVQFFTIPTWDAVWLVQSGMTTSMGNAEAMQMRVWGPLNSTGTASAVWALALLMAFADGRWNGWLRWAAAAVLAVALCLTLVRINWLMLVAGLLMFPLARRGRGVATAANALFALACVVGVVLVALPGGERVTDRLGTFGNLAEDDSLSGRSVASQAMLTQVLDAPWGRGMGFKTAGKVAGASVGIDVVDNGYGDIFLTLGLAGGAVFLLGLATLTAGQARISRRTNFGPVARADPVRAGVAALGLIVPSLLMLANFAAFAFGGAPAVLCWLIVGLANSPEPGRGDR